MVKKFLLLLTSFCLLFIGCSKNDFISTNTTDTIAELDDNVLMVVNGEPLYREELENIKPKYEEMGLTESEIVEGMILELITLQQANRLSISISQEDVESRYKELVELEQSLFYEKVIEQYKSEDNYKAALYNKLLYEEISNKIKESFCVEFSINDTLLQERTQDYTSQYTNAVFEENDINKEVFSTHVAQVYSDSLFYALEDLYFKVWQYQNFQTSELSFDSYNGNKLFQTQEYDITKDILKFRNDSYELEQITLEEIQDRFGNYFYVPNSFKKEYETISGKAIHIPSKDVRALYLTLGTDMPVTIKVIISPILSLYNEFQDNGIIRGTDNGLNEIEYINPYLGIYYSVAAKMEYIELENILIDHIPYTQTNNSYATTETDKFKQETEIVNGNLFFNDCIPSTNDIAYFNPDTARTEQWDLEQVTEYLGTSFYPSYIPETLKLCEDYYSSAFISECIDGSMHWTVAFEEDADAPIFDQFGLYYSDTFNGEYDHLREELHIEVSKDEIPVSDVAYLYATSEKSKIGAIELTIGFYRSASYKSEAEQMGSSDVFVAEFMADDVGYRMISRNLSQEDFIKILTSLPVFQ